MNESINKDFIRKESKRVEVIKFSLDKELSNYKVLKYEDNYTISDNIIDLVDNILMLIENSVTLKEFNLITQIVEGLAYTKYSIFNKNTINIRHYPMKLVLVRK